MQKNKIIVVGGGTAGWISLAYLAATTDAELVIIHSEEVDSMGVGESTTPTIKHVIKACGIEESSWMKDGKATFKYGIEFLNFNQPNSRWLHTFDDLLPGQTFHSPITEFGKNTFKKGISSVEYFLTQRAKGVQGYDIDWYNNSQGGCEYLLKNCLSPYCQAGHANFNKFPGYSYHINAQEFGNSLRKHTPKERYTEIRGHVATVNLDQTGVKNIILKDGTKLSADLFIDCTGFRRELIGKMSDFIPYGGLLNNAAVWGPIKTQVYRPSTLSIAQPHGWIWETPTWGQVGSGYVFSDDFITPEQAEEHLRQHWAQQGLEWNPLRSVKFVSGRLENIAVANVVSNGLGQSFIEPLEATSIMVTCVTIIETSKLFNKHMGWDEKSSKILSKVIGKFLDEIKEFVLGHYTLSDRRDTEYWQAYNNPNTSEHISQIIEKKLQKEWAYQDTSSFNGYNWASMLIGYNKPYFGKLPKIENWQMDNYEFYTKQLVENYRYLYRKNLSAKKRLEQIHGQ